MLAWTDNDNYERNGQDDWILGVSLSGWRRLYGDANGGATLLTRLDTNQYTERSISDDFLADVGLDVMNQRFSFAAAWEDYDHDGDPDLYVANDYGRDNFYRNEGEQSGTVRFVDVSDEVHVEDSAGGMSITSADYDRDGWMDTLVSNMWSSAGQRITHQDQFKADASPEIKSRFQRMARGNTLLRNLGDPGAP